MYVSSPSGGEILGLGSFLQGLGLEGDGSEEAALKLLALFQSSRSPDDFWAFGGPCDIELAGSERPLPIASGGCSPSDSLNHLHCPCALISSSPCLGL